MVPQVKTEVNRLARSYSHSFPAFGARIVTRILSDPDKTLRWKATLRGMVDKIEYLFNSIDRETKGSKDVF